MALPAKLRDLALFSDGNRFLAQVEELIPPKIVRKVEEWLGGGMSAPVQLAYDIEAMKAEWTLKGFEADAIRQAGIPGITGVGLRFVGAYDRDDTGQVVAVEVAMRGRHDEVDLGSMKKGESGATKVVTNLTYCRIEVDGRELFEVDALTGVCVIGGIDQRAAINAALGG
jgi:uncharacterized protein